MNANSSTDNLYKWCVLSGLVICLFALYVPYRFADDLSKRSVVLEVDTRRSEIEANHLSQEAEQLNKTIEAQTHLNADGKPAAKTLSDKEMKEGVNTLDQLRLKLNIQYAEIKAANAELARLHHQGVVIAIIGGVVFILGAGLGLYGFDNWRNKVQAIQDFLLQNELDRLVQEKTGKK
jgi:hypothetical protein